MEMLPTRPHHDLWLSAEDHRSQPPLARFHNNTSILCEAGVGLKSLSDPPSRAVQHHGVRIRDQEPKAWLGSQPLIGLELRALIPLCCPEPVPPTGRLMIVWGFRGAVSPARNSTDQTTILSSRASRPPAVAWAKAYC